jgi:hypothetical protein
MNKFLWICHILKHDNCLTYEQVNLQMTTYAKLLNHIKPNY